MFLLMLNYLLRRCYRRVVNNYYITKDINKRYSAEQALNDPWLKRFIFKDAKDMPEINNALNNMRSFRVNDFY